MNPQRKEAELMRVYELARELDMPPALTLEKLQQIGISKRSSSSNLSVSEANELRASLDTVRQKMLEGIGTPRQGGWSANPVKPSTHPETKFHLEKLQRAFPVAADHVQSLGQLGSQYVHIERCKERGFDDCYIAFVRFSGAIESAFGLTREVMFFYSPHRDLQIRTFKAARKSLETIDREITPDILFMWSPDVRLREKLDDWASGKFLPVPLILSNGEDPIAFISLLRDHIFSRDLFYETSPVRGERFYGRRSLLQSLRDDIREQRVTGLFGLRKAGKTSVLSQLKQNLESRETIVLLRDLESLPSPPHDPIPDLLRDIKSDLVAELRSRKEPARELLALGPIFTISEFKRATQSVLRRLDSTGAKIVVMLDEIEYLTPSDRIDIKEGDLASVAQFLGSLRSLVQENPNFTFMLSGLTSSIIESGRLYGRPNPLFSWAKAHFLAPFSKDEADELARSVGQKMGITIDSGALEALFEASGGHAFLYRHLASFVVETLPINVFHRVMKRANVLLAVTDWRLHTAGNMQEMLDHVKRYYPEESDLLEILREEPEIFGPLAEDSPLRVEPKKE